MARHDRGLVERQPRVHLPARLVARRAVGQENRPHRGREEILRGCWRGGRTGRWNVRGCGRSGGCRRRDRRALAVRPASARRKGDRRRRGKREKNQFKRTNTFSPRRLRAARPSRLRLRPQRHPAREPNRRDVPVSVRIVRILEFEGSGINGNSLCFVTYHGLRRCRQIEGGAG